VGGPNEKAPSAAATMAPSIFWADQGAVGGGRGKPKGLLRNLSLKGRPVMGSEMVVMSSQDFGFGFQNPVKQGQPVDITA
jgi:hypothetical protein